MITLNFNVTTSSGTHAYINNKKNSHHLEFTSIINSCRPYRRSVSKGTTLAVTSDGRTLQRNVPS
jgi:hypothetical protein